MIPWYDDMLCRGRKFASGVHADDIPGQSNDALADDAGGVKRGQAGYKVAASNILEIDQFVLEDILAVLCHCGQHRRPLDLGEMS